MVIAICLMILALMCLVEATFRREKARYFLLAAASVALAVVLSP